MKCRKENNHIILKMYSLNNVTWNVINTSAVYKLKKKKYEFINQLEAICTMQWSVSTVNLQQSLILFVHSVRLLFIHILMLSSHLYPCLPLANFSVSLQYCFHSSVISVNVTEIFHISLYFSSALFSFPAYNKTSEFDYVCCNEILPNLLYVHISRNKQANTYDVCSFLITLCHVAL